MIRPVRIAAAVEDRVLALRPSYAVVVVAYADCGTYSALDEVCGRLGVRRLRGADCYDLFAGTARLWALLEEPGTYVLTDFPVRSFEQTVVRQLGLDRFADVRADYFGHYRRAVWLAQDPTPALHAAALAAADRIGLPLTTVSVGDAGLENELAHLVNAAG